jgi:DNA-binding NarL/FixJ family response regulator
MKNGMTIAAGIPQTTVLLADDQTLVRDALKAVVSSMLGQVCFIEATDGDELLEAMYTNPAAGLALLDARMPAMRGGHRLLEITRRHPDIPLVVLSALASPNLARRLLGFRSVFAVVSKAAPTDSVRAAIAAAVAGRKMAPPTPRCADGSRLAALLTPRQRQICALVREGMSNKVIATALGIGEGTVKNHMTDIFRTLNATNRTQAAQLNFGHE